MIAQIRALSDLIARAKLASVAGKTFGGDRDLYLAFGYDRLITDQSYRDRYRRNPVAARIVEAFPVDTWRSGAELVEDEELEKETEFERAWAALNGRLKILPGMRRLDILAGLGRYAILVIGAPGDMDTPLVRASADEITYLSRYTEEDAPIDQLVLDDQDPRFGQPLSYTLRRTITAAGRTASIRMGKRVHHSRVLHVADGLLDDDVYGTPRLERVWNLLDDLEKIVGGGAEAYFRRSKGGTQVDLDPTLDLDPTQEKEMADEVKDFIHGFKQFITTRGVTMNHMGSDVANFKGPVEAIFDLLAAGTSIPQRVLSGSEQGKLASDQDSVKYYRLVEARRRDFAEAYILRPFVTRLIELGALPAPKDGTYEVKWSQIRTMDDDERTTLALKKAQINTAAGETVVTVDEIRETMDLPPLSEVLNEILDGSPEEQRELATALLLGDATTAERLLESLAPEDLGKLRSLLVGILPIKPVPAPDVRPEPLRVAAAPASPAQVVIHNGAGKVKVVRDPDGRVTGLEAEE